MIHDLQNNFYNGNNLNQTVKVSLTFSSSFVGNVVFFLSKWELYANLEIPNLSTKPFH